MRCHYACLPSPKGPYRPGEETKTMPSVLLGNGATNIYQMSGREFEMEGGGGQGAEAGN